jgi:hypothetical protein
VWNSYNFFKESKIQEDIMNVERDFSRRNPDFDLFSNEDTLFSQNTELENEIKLAIQKVFIKNNIDLEYNPALHKFLRSSLKRVTSIAAFLNNSEANEVRTVIRALRQEQIQAVADKLLEDYEVEFEPFGVTKSEFSKILQTVSANSDPVKEVVQKVGEEKVKKAQHAFNESYLSRLRFNGQNGASLIPLLFGKISPELREKIQDKEAIQSILSEFKLQPGELKKEVLMASEFSSLMYPVSAEFYWPPMKEEYSGIIEEKILETFDINNPNTVIEAIMSSKYGTVVLNDEADKIKVLYKNKFNSDDETFFDFISKTLIKDGNPAETVDNYIQAIRAGLQGSFNKKGQERDERKRDTLFPEAESYFDSIKEKEIVDLIRNEFYLACVASAMEFPITNDFTMNKKNFITDFVIYCDGLDGFQEKEKDGIRYTTPVIKHRLLLIGEYYGYDNVNQSKPLKTDLINPDGTPFLKSDGTPALAGDVLQIGEEYKYKTKYKILTNDFCGRAIGCKTISINKATTKKEQRSEVSRGLDENKVLYNTSFTDVEIKSDALIELTRWYENASDFEKQESKALVGKYINPDTLKKKPGSEYPLSMQNPKSKYLSTIYEAIHLIKSKDLSIAIQRAKESYSIDTLKNKELAAEYLKTISGERAKLAGATAWRIQMLKNLFNEVQGIPVENGGLTTPINNRVFLEFIKNIGNFNKENLEYPNIYAIKRAFNYLKAIKRGIIN